MGGEVNERVLKDVDVVRMKISALELPTPATPRAARQRDSGKRTMGGGLKHLDLGGEKIWLQVLYPQSSANVRETHCISTTYCGVTDAGALPADLRWLGASVLIEFDSLTSHRLVVSLTIPS
jgi:hypothetical protein